MSLNQAQIRAIQHKDGPMLVLAGPGSGKTLVITRRVEYLIKKGKVDPSKILVVTFSKAATNEMRGRFLRIIGKNHTSATFSTFHGLFYTILKCAYGSKMPQISPEWERMEVLSSCVKEGDIEGIEDEEDMKELLEEIGFVKNDHINIDTYYGRCCGTEEFRRAYRLYNDQLHELGKMDFEDILVYTYQLLSNRTDLLAQWQKRFSYLLIDEFQDINLLQFRIICMLVGDTNNVFAVGDEDQSIYHFRGSKPEIMLNFKDYFPQYKQLILDFNYRCTQSILNGALKVIGHNEKRYDKKLISSKSVGDAIEYLNFNSEREEAKNICNRLRISMESHEPLQLQAILFRTNAQANILVTSLIDEHIPFQMKDHMPNIYEHFIAKDLLSYFHMANGAENRNYMLRIMNRPNRYISRALLREHGTSLEDLAYYYEKKGQSWMMERMEEMMGDLRHIKRCSPYAGIQYILKFIKYEDYLKDYSEYRKVPLEDLMDIVEEILALAKPYKTFGEWLVAIANYEEQLQKSVAKGKLQEGVWLMTLHASKGLEFNHVYIIQANEGLMPYKKAVLASQMEEERRLFYVGMTRASEKLTICSLANRNSHEMEISRFVEESRA